MPTQLLDVGELQVTSTATKQSLYLSCSVTLDLPDSISIGQQVKPADVAEMTKSGRVWIAKAASCRLVVKSSVLGVRFGEPEGGEAPWRAVVDAFSGCSVSFPFTPYIPPAPNRHIRSGTT